MEDFIGKYNGGQIESRLDKVKDMVGATASQAGEDGLVPAPAKGDVHLQRPQDTVLVIRRRVRHAGQPEAFQRPEGR